MSQLRPAGPNERRCIVRQELGFYRALVVGGIYSLGSDNEALLSQDIVRRALKHCISAHPILSAVIVDGDTEAPVFVRPPSINLNNHIEFLDIEKLEKSNNDSDEGRLIELTLSYTHDQMFDHSSNTPPWKVVVLQLPDQGPSKKTRYLVLFAYHHSHGDGKSGLAFHKTFLRGLRLSSCGNLPFSAAAVHDTPNLTLLPTLEEAGKLTISWSYLLSPLLGAYLPTWIAEPLNLRAATTPESHDQWRGRETSHDSDAFSTGVELLTINNEIMQKVLCACRTRGAKFTGLLHQLIIRALSEALPADTPAGSFVSETAVDLRHLVKGISNDDMSLCVTGYYELFQRSDPESWQEWTAASSNSPVWDAARSTTNSLAQVSSTLHNQPIGLLRYLNDFYTWTRNQIGKPRSASYEVSNLLFFDPGHTQIDDPLQIESVFFSQPANAGGACLSFHAVSRYQGDLALILSWQVGVLGMDHEQEFASTVCDSIRESLEELAKA